MSAELPEIPGYAIERPLGAGAHARVFLARETAGLRRPVALKVFAPGFRDKYERELEMLRRVEEVRRRERAVEIVQALGSGEHGGEAYIALEYLEEGSLADLVARRGPLPVAEALRYVRDAGRALARLHAEGIFHRDVKPANLVLGRDGRLRLSDFGLSRALSGTLSAAGSPAFAAPEVIAGRPVDGRLADVYSLGATLAWLLTGETMLPGRPDVFALERRQVPRAAQDAIVAATAADPAERVASVEVFLAQLEGAAEDEKSARTKSARSDGDVNPRGAEASQARLRSRGDEAGGPPKGAHPSRSEQKMRTDDLPLDDLKRPAADEEPKTAKGAVKSLVCALCVYPVLCLLIIIPVVLPGEPPGILPDIDRAFRMIVGLILLLFPLALEVLAFVFGFQARERVERSGGRLVGKGLATAGITIAVLNLLIPLALFALLQPPTPR